MSPRLSGVVFLIARPRWLRLGPAPLWGARRVRYGFESVGGAGSRVRVESITVGCSRLVGALVGLALC